LTEFSADIKLTTGPTKAAYMKVKEMTSAQEETTIELPTTLKAPTKKGTAADAADLPTFPGHLYADAKGRFPADLDGWEATVVKTEAARKSFVAWYRNPSRAATSALRIGFLNDSDTWGSLQVDFVVVARRDDGSLAASIVDPHGDFLGDALTKLKGLAAYAERFGDEFVRIVSVAMGTDGSLRSLDLLDPKVRAAVRAYAGAKVTPLYDSEVAEDYK
jgi:hypothetical protein